MFTGDKINQSKGLIYIHDYKIPDIETEIKQIQTKERIPRLQAIRKLLTLNPNVELIYSYAIKNNANPTGFKSPNSSEQQCLSDSSCEDRSETETSKTKPRVRRKSLNFYRNLGREEDNSSTVSTYGYFNKEKGKNKRAHPPHR